MGHRLTLGISEDRDFEYPKIHAAHHFDAPWLIGA
jgi:hypothetical protein